MDLTLLIVLLVVLMGAVGVLVVYLTMSGGGGGGKQQVAVSDSLRSLVASQRQQQRETGRASARKNLALAAAAEDDTRKKRVTSSRLTLEKRLRYGRWVITPIQFRAMQVVLAILGLLLTRTSGLTMALQLLGFALPPLLFNGMLERSIGKRFKMFDADYPVMLLCST